MMSESDRDDAIDKLISDIQISYRVGDNRKLHAAAKRLVRLTQPRPAKPTQLRVRG